METLSITAETLPAEPTLGGDITSPSSVGSLPAVVPMCSGVLYTERRADHWRLPSRCPITASVTFSELTHEAYVVRYSPVDSESAITFYLDVEATYNLSR
jgi:hypothetical protein